MSLYDALILGLVQGLTEFLPISSSGHLVLMQHYLGLTINTEVLLHFDVALHAGSLIAILIYFRTQWRAMVRVPLRKQPDGSPPELLLLGIASIPLAIAGFSGAGWIAENTHTPLFVAFGFIFTGILLITAGWYESRFAAKESCGWNEAIGAGIGQALAIFPGFSRAGLTLSSGRLMGLSATRATEFAFLLGAPALAGALLHTVLVGRADLSLLSPSHIIIGFTVSLAASLLVMHAFLSTIRRYGVWVWTVYLFTAAVLVIADEMLPLVQAIPGLGDNLELKVVAGTLFLALLLEAAPFSSFFVPGFAAMVALGVIFADDPWSIAACIPIGAAGLAVGNLLGYIPARQARAHVRWKEKADQRLRLAQLFFRKWGKLAVFFGTWWGPLRPLISIAAGLGGMRPTVYVLTMIAGCLVWISLVMVGSAIVFGGAFS